MYCDINSINTHSRTFVHMHKPQGSLKATADYTQGW